METEPREELSGSKDPSEIAPVDSESPRLPGRKLARRVFVAGVATVAVYGGWLATNRLKTSRFEKACAVARQQRDWRSLRNVARDWIQWDPQSSAGWWRAAEASQQLEDLEDLADCLGHILPDDPKYAYALAEKANLEWTALNRPLDALKTSEAAVERDPRLVEVHSRIISFYAMTLQRAPMLNAIRRSMASRAEPKECYSYLIVADVLTFSNADDINGRWLAACPDEATFKVGLGVQTAMNVAQTEASDRSEEVLAVSKEARDQIQWFLKALPGNPVLLSFLMHQAYQRSDVTEMGNLLQQVDDRGAKDHMVWVYRGWYHAQVKDYDEADQSLKEAIRLHPISPLAWHEKAQLLRTRQSPETEKTQRIASYGRELRSQILQMATAASLTPQLILQIQSYAKSCGDSLLAEAASNRLRNLNIR